MTLISILIFLWLSCIPKSIISLCHRSLLKLISTCWSNHFVCLLCSFRKVLISFVQTICCIYCVRMRNIILHCFTRRAMTWLTNNWVSHWILRMLRRRFHVEFWSSSFKTLIFLVCSNFNWLKKRFLRRVYLLLFQIYFICFTLRLSCFRVTLTGRLDFKSWKSCNWGLITSWEYSSKCAHRKVKWISSWVFSGCNL